MKNGSRKFFSLVFLAILSICLVQGVINCFADGSSGNILSSLCPDTKAPASAPISSSLLPDGKTVDTLSNAHMMDWLLPGFVEPEVDLASIQPRTYEISASGVNVLIYHTHATESYRMTAEGEYVETTSYRSNDQSHNIIKVGEALKAELEACGFHVVHDTANYEPPKLSTAYDRSLAGMQNYQKLYPEIDIYIDVHRDAAGDFEKGKEDVVVVDGKRCARVMFVVGRGKNYSVKANLEENYTLAKSITAELEAICKNFTRPIRVKDGRYNQQVGDMCMLIEVGHNANTLEEALNTVPYIAKSISKVISVVE